MQEVRPSQDRLSLKIHDAVPKSDERHTPRECTLASSMHAHTRTYRVSVLSWEHPLRKTYYKAGYGSLSLSLSVAWSEKNDDPRDLFLARSYREIVKRDTRFTEDEDLEKREREERRARAISFSNQTFWK